MQDLEFDRSSDSEQTKFRWGKLSDLGRRGHEGKFRQQNFQHCLNDQKIQCNRVQLQMQLEKLFQFMAKLIPKDLRLNLNHLKQQNSKNKMASAIFLLLCYNLN